MAIAKKIEISERNFRRIQELAEPLIDTLDSVLARVLDHYEENKSRSGKAAAASQKKIAEISSAELFDPVRPPDLTHTRVLEAQICGRSLRSPNWNAIIDETFRIASTEMTGLFSLRKVAPINFVEGVKTDEGYHYLSDIRISVQGQSANDAWRSISRIARHFGFKVEVLFVWREKEGAAQPGRDGRFLIPGRS